MKYSEDQLLALASGTRRVLTPEGVRKYGEPIGALINPDGISQKDKMQGNLPEKRAAGARDSLKSLRALKGNGAKAKNLSSKDDKAKSEALRQAAAKIAQQDKDKKNKKSSAKAPKAPLSGVGKATDRKIMEKFADAMRRGASVSDAYDKTVAWVHTDLGAGKNSKAVKTYAAGFKPSHLKALLDREAANFGGKDFADKVRAETQMAKTPSLNPSDRYLATKKFVRSFAEALRKVDFPAPMDPWSIADAKLMQKLKARVKMAQAENVVISSKLLEAVRREMLDIT